MLELQRRLAAAVVSYAEDGRYAAAVSDLQTGETISVNGDRQQLSGCVMNFFVLLLSEQDVADGAPIDRVASLIDTTIYGSNASTARQLYALAGNGDSVAGVRRVAALIQSLGLTDTIIDHPPSYPDESIGVSADNFITALDANQALSGLYSGATVSEPARSDLIERMTNVKPGLNYLLAYGTGGTVSHKNGFFQIGDGTFVDNDIAIVRFRRSGREYAYAISFLSEYVPHKYGDVSLGQQISKMAWDFFDARYR